MAKDSLNHIVFKKSLHIITDAIKNEVEYDKKTHLVNA